MSREIDEIKEAAGAYRRWALEARKKYIALRQRQDPEIRGLYIRSADRVARELRRLVLGTPSSYLRKRQLKELEKALRAEAKQVTGGIEKVLGKYIEQAVDAGGGYNKAIALNLLKKAGIDISGLHATFASVNRQAVEACWARTKKGLHLSNRIWRQGENYRNAVRDIIQEAVATGKDAVKTARMLEQYVRQGKKTLAADYPEMMKRMGGRIPGDICYEALRLARTEMTAAFGEGTLAAAQASPSYVGMKWAMSAAHPMRDICIRLGTQVETTKGAKAIENVSIGDMVLTHNLRWRRVTRLYRRTIRSGAMIRLQFQVKRSRTRDVVMTPNHPVLTDQGWIPAGDLQMGCRVAFSPLTHGVHASQLRHDGASKALLSSGENGTLLGVKTFCEERCGADEHFQHYTERNLRQDFQQPSLPPMSVGDICQYFPPRPSSWGFWPPFFREKVCAELPQSEKTCPGDGCRSLGYPFRTLGRIFDCSRFVFCCRTKTQTLFYRLGKIEAWRHDRLNNNHWSRTCDLDRQEKIYCKRGKLFQPWLSGCEQHISDCKNVVLRNVQVVPAGREGSLFPRHSIRNSSFPFYHLPYLSYINYSMQERKRPLAMLISKEIISTGNEEVFNLEVEEDNSYTANGLMVHNCDLLAAHDEGLGPGVYAPGNEPPFPAHPNCICHIIPVHEQPEDFVKRLKKWKDDPNSDKELENWYNEIYQGKAKDTQERLRRAADKTRAEQKALKTALDKAEAVLIRRKTEKAIVFADDGTIIFEKPGGKSSVSFTPDEVKLFKDKIFTHNHPSGTSFSVEDIAFAAVWDLKEIRACGKYYRYYLKRPSTGWSREYWSNTLKPLVEKHDKNVYKETVEQIRKGKITVDKANLRHWHEVWSRVAKEAGLDYGREKW